MRRYPIDSLSRRLIVAAAAALAAACQPAAGPASGPAPVDAGTPAAQRDRRVYQVAEVEEQPELQNAGDMPRLIRTYYPTLGRDAGLSGNVVVRMVLGVDGHPERSSIQVVTSTSQLFEEGAQRVAAAMRFSPAKVNGQPVRVEMRLPIAFTLP
ncbi:MAG TPA: energy transducer TonB [Longimicrobium sp.]|jgi:TonB family protein|nr:energy transducer TonB [Longimicrobium sp.]